MADIGSTLPRRQVGRYLRELRQGAGLTIAELARRIERGATTVQRLETGTAERIRLWDIDAICRVCGADETTAVALKGLAQQGNSKNWWHQFGDLIPLKFDVYMGLEAGAVKLAYFAELVPGLLQIPDYARTLTRLAHPTEPDSEIVRRVEMRVRRQVQITKKSRPLPIDVILDESALYRVIGSHRIMAAQLRHLADTGTRPNVSVRILPFAAGLPFGDLTGPFIILDFPPGSTGESAEPPVVYAEGYTGAMYFDDPELLHRYRTAHTSLRRVALDEQESRKLLRERAREFAG
ncbi:helix-turn-helix domain-containing protein [Nocardia speluncae]|uniref:Helix-turn-helix domain-containing protein n=1 Tax=Nocardia speluncae TaxID=419477 RepID=A0A846XKS4_9NOCA|nr:helix-turn-helix transcriptional regulator [Nocardia speluncae]NKY35869.1 helix-turn-helix domain-containing protein [Nocardia speluncae]